MALNKCKQYCIFLLKIAVGLILLGFLLSKVDWHNLLDSIRYLKINSVAMALIFFCGIIFTESLRLLVIFRSYSINIINLIRINLIGSIFALLTPGQIGSDIYKVYAIREPGDGILKPIFLLMFLRLCAIFTIILSFVVAVLFNYELIVGLIKSGSLKLLPLLPDNYGVVIIMAIIILAGIVAARFVFPRFKNLFTRLRSGYKQAKAEITWSNFIILILLSFTIMLFRILMFYFLVLSLGYESEIGQLLLVTTLAMIGTMLPISVGGLGVREGIIVVMLMLFNIPYEPATIVALISRSFILLAAIIGGAWFYLTGGIGVKNKENPGN